MELVIVDIEDNTEVARFNVAVNQPIPRIETTVWVPENGDVAYWVKGVQFDYVEEEVIVRTVKEPDVDRAT